MRKTEPVFVLAIVACVSVGLGMLTDKSLCFFYRITGIPCPSCGMTRAWLSFFQGDTGGAFLYHPLFFSIVALVAIPFCTKWKRESKERVYIGLGVAFLVVWIVRLVLFFPHTIPMLLDDSALIPFLWSKFWG